MSRKEETQKLLSSQLPEEEDSDEDILFTSERAHLQQSSEPSSPPPSYSVPEPATLIPSQCVEYPQASAPELPTAAVPPPTVVPEAVPMAAPVPIDEAPPEYFLHDPKEASLDSKSGLAVHIQMNGQLVPGTVMEDATGRHMVYICQPRTTADPVAASSDGKPPPPKDYIFLSLLSVICCCAPLGIVALIKSLEVHRLYRNGDYAGAARASRQAHSWGSAAVVFGCTIIIIIFALKIYLTEFGHNRHYSNYYYY